MTVTLTKFNNFVQDLAHKVHNLSADTFKVLLTNTAPVATNAVLADIAGEVASGAGYTTGGNAASITSCAQTAGVLKFILANPATWTSSGTLGPFRYAVLYNATASGGPLIGFADYGSALTLASAEMFTVQFDATAGALQIA